MRTLSYALALAMLVPGVALADSMYGSTPSPSPSAVPSTGPSAKPAVVVHIKDFAFVPIKLAIHEGQAVEFINDDTVPHDATADDGSFASPELAKGESYVYVFAKDGTFTYVCKDHPFMHASITVGAPAK